jgi:16S rRNA (adenine1518-N6/adenine1519-N6)-dimethyltransferase
VGKGYFYPSPKVDSAVIKITPDDEVSGRITEPSAYFKVVRCGFAQRRKSFVNSFSASSGVAKDRTFKMLSDLGIDENIRAEKLTIDELIALAEYAEENNLFSK